MIVTLEGQVEPYFPDKKGFKPKTTELSLATKLIFIGNASFLTDQIVNQFPNNSVLFLNLTDWLTLDSDVFDLPNRGNVDNPIRLISDELRVFIKWIATLIIPIILAIYGIFGYWKKKNEKRRNG